MSEPLAFVSDSHVWWYCPGCEKPHGVPFEGPQGWQFNGDAERPTLSPSVLAQWDWGPEREHHVCHSFMRDGRLEYLGDCTHGLAGQTVAIVPWEGWGT